MAVTLVATVGGATSNTLATLAEAETYFETRLHDDDWTDASTADKNSALAWAGMLLNTLTWKGDIAATTQAMCWPRDGAYDRNGNEIATTTIPQDIKYGQIEWAFWLIQEDLAKDAESIGMDAVTVDVINVKFDKTKRKKDFIPNSVMQYLNGYLFGTAWGTGGSLKSMRLMRV